MRLPCMSRAFGLRQFKKCCRRTQIRRIRQHNPLQRVVKVKNHRIRGSLLFSLDLSADVQQYPDAGQGAEQRRPSGGDQRQRNPLGGHQRKHDADIEECLQ